jgi:hypothetical protein
MSDDMWDVMGDGFAVIAVIGAIIGAILLAYFGVGGIGGWVLAALGYLDPKLLNEGVKWSLEPYGIGLLFVIACIGILAGVSFIVGYIVNRVEG